MLHDCGNLVLVAKGETASRARLDVFTIRFYLKLAVNVLRLKPWGLVYNILTPVLSMAWDGYGDAPHQ